jgi:hypothetical protein
MIDLGNFGRPGTFTDAKLNLLWARLTNRMSRFQLGLRNFIAKGLQNGKVNIGYFYNAKGIVAEIFAETFRQGVLSERQKTQPKAQQFDNVYVSRPGSPEPVQFTDGLIGHPGSSGDLTITDRFEVKSGPAGGEQAGRQYYKWVESHITDGTKLLLNRRPAVPGETLLPGQEKIGGMVYDVYYWNPTSRQQSISPNLRKVTGLSGAGTLHAVIPEGASVLSVASGDRTAPVKVTDLPATASEIDYMTRLMMEHLSPPATPAPQTTAAAAGAK